MDIDLPIITSTIQNLIQINDNLKHSENLKSRLININQLAKKVHDQYKEIPPEALKDKPILEIIQALMKQISEQMKSDNNIDPDDFHEQMKNLIDLIDNKLKGTKPPTLSDKMMELFGIKKPSEETKKTLEEIEQDNKKLIRGDPVMLKVLHDQYNHKINNNYIETIISFALSNLQLFILELLHIDTFYQTNYSLFVDRSNSMLKTYKPIDIPTLRIKGLPLNPHINPPVPYINSKFFKELTPLNQYIFLLISIIKDKFDCLHIKEIIGSLLDVRFGTSTSLKTRFNIVYSNKEINEPEIESLMYQLLNLQLYCNYINDIHIFFKDNPIGDIFQSKVYKKLIKILKLYQPIAVTADNTIINYLITKIRPRDKDLPLFLLFNAFKSFSYNFYLNSIKINNDMIRFISKIHYEMKQLPPYTDNIDITSILLDDTTLYSNQIFDTIQLKLEELFYRSYDKKSSTYIVTRQLIKYYQYIIESLIHIKYQIFKENNKSPIYIDVKELLNLTVINNQDIPPPNDKRIIDKIKSMYTDLYTSDELFNYLLPSNPNNNTFRDIRLTKIKYIFYHFNTIYHKKQIHVRDINNNILLEYINSNLSTNINDEHDINSHLYEICKDYVNESIVHNSMSMTQYNNIGNINVNVTDPNEVYIKSKYDLSNKIYTAIVNSININTIRTDMNNTNHKMNPNNISNNNLSIDLNLLFPTIDNIDTLVNKMNEYVDYINNTITKIKSNVNDQINTKTSASTGTAPGTATSASTGTAPGINYTKITKLLNEIEILKNFKDVKSNNLLVTYYKALNLYHNYNNNLIISLLREKLIEINQLNESIVDAADKLVILTDRTDKTNENIDNMYIEIKIYESHMVQLMLIMVCLLPCLVYEYMHTTISNNDSILYCKQIDDFISLLLSKMILICNPPYELIYYNETNNDESKRESAIDNENKTLTNLKPGIQENQKIDIFNEIINQEKNLLQMYDNKYVHLNMKELQYLYDNPVTDPLEIYDPTGNKIKNPDNILNKQDTPSLIYQFIDQIIDKNQKYNFELQTMTSINNVDDLIMIIVKYKYHYIKKYEIYLSQEYVQHNLLDKMLKEHSEEKIYSILSRFLLSS